MMIEQLSKYIALAIMVASPIATANIEVRFVESAPKDRFVIENTGNCVLDKMIVNIDLTNSTGRLIFDTTGDGAGVEVFQPFEVTKGSITLLAVDRVMDGDTSVSLGIDTLQPGETSSFTIDVDDTLTDSEFGKIRVSGSEIQSGLVTIRAKNTAVYKAEFGRNSLAVVELPPCPET